MSKDGAAPDQRLLDLAGAMDEPLHPDLEPYLVDGPFGKMLHHPLLVEIFLAAPGLTNRAYLAKRKQFEEAQEEGDLNTLVYVHERPYRCQALIEHVVGTNEYGDPNPLASLHRTVRDIAVGVWTDSENIGEFVDEWDAMFSGWEPGDELILGNDEERATFAALPDEFRVWRGDCHDGGWSWTTDRAVAVFFAERFARSDGDKHDLLTGVARKDHVFGYIGRRKESEVLIRREHVRSVKVIG